MLSGPMFDPAEDLHRKSVYGKSGGHYNIYATRDSSSAMDFLRAWFPEERPTR